jgi:AmmeMemoRadiSam system protein A
MSHPEGAGDVPVLGPADYALACVRRYVGGGRAAEPPDDAFYARRAACFVTLKKNGELRGCIGTLEPAETSLGWEIARNAHSSAMRDPRFPAVTMDELEALTCSVDVLGSSEPCTVADLDPQTYGVIVEAGFRRGVLLPALSGVDTVDLQVNIARQKAGIPDDQPFDVRRFRVTRYRQGDAAVAADDPASAPSDD